jgi:hypothetical protein
MKIIFLSCCVAFLLGPSILKADLLLQPNDRLAICGDGMTADWGYSIYLEDYLLMNQPIAGLDVEQFGWMANDPAGFLARMDADMLPFKPTVVVTSFNSGDVATRGKMQTDLVEALKKAGVRTIVIGSPVCVDSYTYQNDPAKGAAENQRLAALANTDKDVATKEGVGYADVYGATLSAMQKEKALRGESFPFGTDRDVFNMAVASAFLKALGCDGAIGTITYDAAAGAAVGSPGQKIVSVKDRTIAIESTIPAFWFPGHNIAPDAPRPDPLLPCIPFNQDLDRYMLIAKNLPTSQTKVYLDDQNRDFSSEELAKGVNLAEAEAADHPFGGITGSVNDAVIGQHQMENVLGTALVQGKPDPQADAKREAALQLAKSRVGPVKFNIVIQPLVTPDPQPPGPIPVIVDTDMDSDIDDVAALALLNDFMDQGECNILACLHDTTDGKDLSSCATIEAINTYYGHPSIPIGQAYAENDPSVHMTSILAPAPTEGYHSVPGSWSTYTLKVHQRFDPTFPNDDKMPPAVDVYRKTLAAATDGTVVICSIGNMQSFQDLLLSQPDSVSPLNGVDLARKKVRELVIMFNTTPQDKYLLGKWPTKILWSTDIGNHIALGASLVKTPENNPVRVIFNGGTRQGWDPTAAWLAVRGTGAVYDVIAGDQPNMFFSTVKMPDYLVQKLFDDELARPPKP